MEKDLRAGIDEFEIFFKEDLDAIDIELEKSKQYSEIIDSEIQKLIGTNSLGANRGVQHHLIEHISNAVELQSQRQSLRKDRFNIRKTIVEYANKFSKKESSENGDLLVEIQKLLDMEKEKKVQDNLITVINDTDLDAEMDSILLEEGNE